MLDPNRVRYIVFREKGVWHAVGIEFNIVESGDTLQEVLLMLFEALEGYTASAERGGISLETLARGSDGEYERLWESIVSGNPQAEVFSSGTVALASRELFQCVR